MSTAHAVAAIAGLAVITIVTRALFLLSRREPTLPRWLQRGLRHAPLAALAAVVGPEVLVTQGQLAATWQDARIWATLVAIAYYLWRRGMLGTILSGTAVMVALRLGLGW